LKKKIGKSIYNPPQTIIINVPIELPIVLMFIHKLPKNVDLPSNDKNIYHKIIKISKTKKKKLLKTIQNNKKLYKNKIKNKKLYFHFLFGLFFFFFKKKKL
jgi:hypothetical protein